MMTLSDLHRSHVFAALARYVPKLTIRLARMAAWHDNLRDTTPKRHQMQANFKSAFPELSPAALASLCARHRSSMYRSGVVLTHLRQMSCKGLHRHASRHVHYCDPGAVKRIADHDGPVIMLTPHYGAYLSASLKLLVDIGSSKRLNIFFDDPAKNTTNIDYQRIYQRYGGNASVLFNNRRSIVTALKALQQNQVLTMMPDVYDVSGNCVAVPFFGGLTHAMTGTAFFALKTQALLVPVYCYNTIGLDCEIDIQQAIPLSKASNFEQALYETTAAIFANIEAQLIDRPEHWVYWKELGRRFPCTTRLPAQTDGDWAGQLAALLVELRTQTPALAPLLEEVERQASMLDVHAF